MRISSALLFDVARSVELDVQRPGERTLEIPPVLLPSVDIPIVQSPPTPFSVTDPQRGGFFATNELIRNNQPELTQTICTLGQGLWFIRFIHWYFANFTSNVSAGNGAMVLLTHPDSGGNFLHRIEPIGTTQIIQERSFYWLLPEDNWRVEHRVAVTGAGELSHSKISLSAVKYL